MHCRLDNAAALEAQIREAEAAHPVGLLGDAIVLRNGARAARLNTPASEHNALLRWSVALEGGGARRGEVHAWDLPERGSYQQDGKWFVLRDLALPDDLPLGYHRLSVELEFAGTRECAAHRDAGQMPRARGHRRGCAALGRGRAALHAALGKQLGYRRLHGSGRVAAPGRRGRRGLRRHQSRACAVSRRIRCCSRRIRPRAVMR